MLGTVRLLRSITMKRRASLQVSDMSSNVSDKRTDIYRNSRKLSVIVSGEAANFNDSKLNGNAGRMRKFSHVFTSDQGRKLSGTWSHKRAGNIVFSI